MSTQPKHMRALIRELIETVILALLIFLGLQFSIQNFRVEGLSMQPTIEERQLIVVNKLIYFRPSPLELHDSPLEHDNSERCEEARSVNREDTLFPFHTPSRGEIIIFHYPQDTRRDFVKRVIGVPGDTVEIKSGQVFVNGDALDEPYVKRPSQETRAARTLSPGCFYVLGDNRRASNDSRDWGPVPAENIIGRAWVSYWPLDRLGTLSAFFWR